LLHIDGWQHKGAMSSTYDEIEILIPCDSPTIFPSLENMWNSYSLQKRRKMTLLKQFIKPKWMCEGVMFISLYHEGFKSSR